VLYKYCLEGEDLIVDLAMSQKYTQTPSGLFVPNFIIKKKQPQVEE